MFRLLHLLSILCLPIVLFASPRKQIRNRRPPPKVILVMLSTETNRYKALVGDGRKSDAEGLLRDRDEIQRVTKADFKKHFNFCPVYFFYDTELDKIKSKDFTGILFNVDSSAAPADAVTDTNFLIVYYGIPTWQTGRYAMEVTSQATVGGKPNGRGLILNNHEMKQVGYVYWLGVPGNRVYSQMHGYQSQKFDLEYMPLSRDLNSKLYRYSGQQPPVQEKKSKRRRQAVSEDN